MLTVTQVDYIKHLRENEDASISEIAFRLQCDWKTAKKYADGDINLQERGKRTRKKTVMEGFDEYLKDWLLEDRRVPRSQRRTAKVMFKDCFLPSYMTEHLSKSMTT